MMGVCTDDETQIVSSVVEGAELIAQPEVSELEASIISTSHAENRLNYNTHLNSE